MKSESKSKGKKESGQNNNNRSGLQKLNSKYILKQIFDNLEDIRAYEIFRYNKNIQQKLNIDINLYKELSLEKSPIIIEIIPVENKKGKIFNYVSGSNRNYHMYFNDSNKEQYTNKIGGEGEEDEEDDDDEQEKEEKEEKEKKEENQAKEEEENIKVKKIKLVIDYKVDSFENLFEDCNCIESINFKRFTRINIKDMRSMFWQCSNLKEANLEKFNTDNVTNMSWMFYRCSQLKKINISNSNIDNVEKMVGMFWGCSSLEEINLPNFKDDNNINVKCMFSECSNDLKKKVKEQNKNIGFEAFT